MDAILGIKRNMLYVCALVCVLLVVGLVCWGAQGMHAVEVVGASKAETKSETQAALDTGLANVHAFAQPIVADGQADNFRPNTIDVEFAQGMTEHHQQALEMSYSVLDRASPEVSALAHRIILNQSSEIGRMQGWLEVWGAPPVAAVQVLNAEQFAGGGAVGENARMSIEEAMARSICGVPFSESGMATQEEINALQNMQGEALDTRFLQLMIRHHEGGVRMAQRAKSQSATPLVQGVAKVMAYEQFQETNMMLMMLHQLGGAPLPSIRLGF